jgi:hypothetical protein
MNSRRLFLAQLSAFVIAGPTVVRAEVTAPLVQVYKSATCGCCSKWVDHLRAAGFAVEATNVPDVNLYKLEYGVPSRLASCHTALVEGYVVEGHVPADDVIRLLRQRPEILGIAVPGMPLGSPGMESSNPERYETIAFDAAGSQTVFAVHTP